MIFIDTSILIDHANGKLTIEESVFETSYINSIVQLEFLVGALNKRELKKLNNILTQCTLVKVEQDILDLSVNLINQYGLSHNMGIYDAIIAATCMVYDLELWTHNKKDFRFLDIVLV